MRRSVMELTAYQRANSVLFEGYLYATLDFAEPEEKTIGTQSAVLTLPLGWEDAPNESDIVNDVIAKYPWGTLIVVAADGSGFGTSAYTKQGGVGTRLFEEVLVSTGER